MKDNTYLSKKSRHGREAGGPAAAGGQANAQGLTGVDLLDGFMLSGRQTDRVLFCMALGVLLAFRG